jgi:NADPH:quinone reductase-like Zn-dependent oxidoreductase
MLLGPMLSRFGGKSMSLYMAKLTQQDLVSIRDLLEAGKLVPVIDRCYLLAEAAEALRYFEDVHPQGKVVITA